MEDNAIVLWESKAINTGEMARQKEGGGGFCYHHQWRILSQQNNLSSSLFNLLEIIREKGTHFTQDSHFSLYDISSLGHSFPNQTLIGAIKEEYQICNFYSAHLWGFSTSRVE